MKIVACSITREHDPCQTKIFKSFEKINQYHPSKKIELKLKCGNSTMGLSEYYNNCIDNYGKSCDYMIFVHDDVDFINMDLHYQIEKSMELYDIIGVAGCANPTIGDVNLWHLMSQKQDLKGFAGHTCKGVALLCCNTWTAGQCLAISILSSNSSFIRSSGIRHR